VKHPETGVKTQPHVAILTFKSYPGQHRTPHYNFIIQVLPWFVFCRTHMTLYLFASLMPVITILHYELAGGRDWSSPWDGLRSKHPSISCKPVD